MVLGESSTFVACLHKQIPFGSFLDDVRKQPPMTPQEQAYIKGPIFVVDRFNSFIHSYSISFSSSTQINTLHFPYFPTPTMALNPPPLKLYNCASLALNDIREFIKGQGYAVTTFRLKTIKQSLPTVRKIWLRCAKNNSYKSTARTRLISSRMTDCPFELTLICTAIGWQVEVQELTHNHEAFAHATALPHYRQRTKETNKTIANISASSITPSKILIRSSYQPTY